VSVGGGAVGAPLLEAAAAARRHTALADRTWRLLGGANGKRHESGDGLIVEPARPDFTSLLCNSTLSISQAGYNTVVETLACADRAVLVPFGTDRETEQTDRATWLAERGLVTCLPAGCLSAETLAAAVDGALQRPSIRSFPPCDLGGASRTAALLHERLS
jgi:predicted glycosyltransferase